MMKFAMADQILKFPREQNANGTFDLTCPFCRRVFSFGVHDGQVEETHRSHGCWEEDQRFLDSAVNTPT